MKITVIGVIALLSSLAAGQSIQVSAGDSTIMQASGASARILFANSSTELSGGIVNGRTVFGAAEVFKLHGWDISAGDVALPLSFKTDFNDGIRFSAIGLLGTRKRQRSTLTIFAGETALQYQLPYFFGSKGDTATVGFFYSYKATKTLTFDSAEVFSDKQTAIQSLTWKPFEALTLSGAAGLGSNAPFVAGKLSYKTQRLHLKINDTKRAIDFRRVISPYSTVEDSGLNVDAGITLQHFTASAGHNTVVSESKNVVTRSTVDSFGLGGNVSIVNLSGTTFLGMTDGKSVSGQQVGAGVAVSFLTAHADYYKAAGHASSSFSFSEKVSRRFSVNQFIQRSHFNLGGDYHSNLMTVSVGYSMSFYPALVSQPFQKTLSVTLSFQLPGGMRVDGGTLALPNGKLKWTAFGSKYAQGRYSDIVLGSGGQSAGKYQFKGTVVDTSGEPIAGALVIGKIEVFCNAKGEFIQPVRKLRMNVLRVVPEDFVTPGRWEVVSAPETITPEKAITIVVRRVQQQ